MDVELLTGLGVAAFILAISVLVGEEVGLATNVLETQATVPRSIESHPSESATALAPIAHALPAKGRVETRSGACCFSQGLFGGSGRDTMKAPQVNMIPVTTSKAIAGGSNATHK